MTLEDCLPQTLQQDQAVAPTMTPEQRRQVSALQREMQRVLTARPAAAGVVIVAATRTLAWTLAQLPDHKVKADTLASILNTLPLYVESFKKEG